MLKSVYRYNRISFVHQFSLVPVAMIMLQLVCIEGECSAGLILLTAVGISIAAYKLVFYDTKTIVAKTTSLSDHHSLAATPMSPYNQHR
jgi:hypothetical protein